MISGTTPTGGPAPTRSGAVPVATLPPAKRPTTRTETSPLAQSLAVEPPIDADRVRTIRAAIAEGTFPITPAKLADAIIAARWLLIDGAEA